MILFLPFIEKLFILLFEEYGTGYYMTVEVLGGDEKQKPIEVAHYDMRYIGTSDIEKASRIAANEYWGENLEEFKIVKTYKK